jgi:hypothetical protein
MRFSLPHTGSPDPAKLRERGSVADKLAIISA